MSNKNKKRGILNQVVEEPIVETNLVTEEEVVAQEEFINEAETEFPPAEAIELVGEIISSTDIGVEVEMMKIIQEKTAEEPCCACADPECICHEEVCVCKEEVDAEFESTLDELMSLPDVQDETGIFAPYIPLQVTEAPLKAQRSVESLTRAELHRFNTTGIMPE
jgi:hypothetical protein